MSSHHRRGGEVGNVGTQEESKKKARKRVAVRLLFCLRASNETNTIQYAQGECRNRNITDCSRAAGRIIFYLKLVLHWQVKVVHHSVVVTRGVNITTEVQ